MRGVVSIIALLLFLASASVVSAQSSNPADRDEASTGPSEGDQNLRSWQQFTGADYLTLPDVDREAYAAGLSDAYNWTYMGGFRKMHWMVTCTNDKWGLQLAAMFDKWLEEHPDRWDEPAAKLFAFAVFQQCDFGIDKKAKQ